MCGACVLLFRGGAVVLRFHRGACHVRFGESSSQGPRHIKVHRCTTHLPASVHWCVFATVHQPNGQHRGRRLLTNRMESQAAGAGGCCRGSGRKGSGSAGLGGGSTAGLGAGSCCRGRLPCRCCHLYCCLRPCCRHRPASRPPCWQAGAGGSPAWPPPAGPAPLPAHHAPGPAWPPAVCSF
jgi:hypothetical protein